MPRTDGGILTRAAAAACCPSARRPTTRAGRPSRWAAGGREPGRVPSRAGEGGDVGRQSGVAAGEASRSGPRVAQRWAARARGEARRAGAADACVPVSLMVRRGAAAPGSETRIRGLEQRRPGPFATSPSARRTGPLADAEQPRSCARGDARAGTRGEAGRQARERAPIRASLGTPRGQRWQTAVLARGGDVRRRSRGRGQLRGPPKGSRGPCCPAAPPTPPAQETPPTLVAPPRPLNGSRRRGAGVLPDLYSQGVLTNLYRGCCLTCIGGCRLTCIGGCRLTCIRR